MLRNLYIAYAVTWAANGLYMVYLWRRQQRLKREQAALRK